MSQQSGGPRSSFEQGDLGLEPEYDLRGTQRVVMTGAHDRKGPELRIRSETTARVVAGVLVAALGYSLFRWAHTTLDLLRPCATFALDNTGVCSEPPAVLRWLQLVIGMSGVVVGVVVIGYFGWFAATGKTWRRRREVAIVLSALVAAWLAVYLVGILNV